MSDLLFDVLTASRMAPSLPMDGLHFDNIIIADKNLKPAFPQHEASEPHCEYCLVGNTTREYEIENNKAKNSPANRVIITSICVF